MNVQYKQEIAKYGKKDGIIALVYFLYWVVIQYVSLILVGDVFILPFGSIARLAVSWFIWLAPMFVYVLVKERSLASIGFHRRNFGRALLVGLAFSALALSLREGLLPGLVLGWEFHPLNTFLYFFLFTLLAASVEDIAFMGFIQPRLYGLIRKDILAVLAGAFLFGFIHVTGEMIYFGPAHIMVTFSFRMYQWMVFFIIWNLIFRKYFSLFPVIMLHTAANLAGINRFWVDAGPGDGVNSVFSFYLLVVAVIAWALVSWLRSRKVTPGTNEWTSPQ